MHILNASYLKLDKLDKALTTCDKVLEKDPENVKAIYRKGEALMALKKPEQGIIIRFIPSIWPIYAGCQGIPI
jgi:tetratricopeptide (TPR) repeat protein